MTNSKITFTVSSYSEFDDTFTLKDNGGCGHEMVVPSLVVASLCKEWGEPDEFMGKEIDFPFPS